MGRNPQGVSGVRRGWGKEEVEVKGRREEELKG